MPEHTPVHMPERRPELHSTSEPRHSRSPRTRKRTHSSHNDGLLGPSWRCTTPRRRPKH
jgi:hypothetical protein